MDSGLAPSARPGMTAERIVAGLSAADGASVDGGADHLPDLGIRQEQVVVDEAPALRRGVDHAQPQSLELSLLGGADALGAAGDPARHRERAVVGRGDDGDLARDRSDALDRGREHVHVDVGRCEHHRADLLDHHAAMQVVDLA